MFTRYVALGDSTTEGLDDPYPDRHAFRGWADRLAELIDAREPGLQYANLAVRGRKMFQIREQQLACALALEPDLASVVGGLNDILRRHVDLGAVTDHLEAMIAALRDTEATVLTLTFPDPGRVMPLVGATVRDRVGAYNEEVRAIAGRHGAVLADLERRGVADPRLWSVDRLHANSEGHARVAGATAEALGVVEPTGWWAEPLPDAAARPALPAVVVRETLWAGRHLVPWIVRRARGRSSGDGREPKRPVLAPMAP